LPSSNSVPQLQTITFALIQLCQVARALMGEQQEIETLISEEALLFTQYLRNEKHQWIPRAPNFN
jgi:hypothetical protein